MAMQNADKNERASYTPGPISPGPLDSLLSLIAATVLADRRACASDVSTFLKDADVIKLVRGLGFKTSEAHLLYWYEFNKGAILDSLSSLEFKSWFLGHLKQLSNLPDKKPVLDVMRKVSAGEGQAHVNALALIALTERHWQKA